MGALPSQKYDRQLRIWGEHGQERLANSKICLINAGATGAESLKSLVLGGIGEFTIVDGCTVEVADLGNNFLVDQDSLGQLRARVVSTFLQELNSSVVGKFVEEDPESLIATNPEFFAKFTLVIATQLSESLLARLDDICRAHGCPLIAVRSYGLAGLVRISTPEHCVMETKPDSALDDLRLSEPWGELQEVVEGFDLDIDDSAIHSHIPFVIILLKSLQEWRAAMLEPPGSTRVPGTPTEKAAFKQTVASHRRGLDEENYTEALASAFKVWSPPTMRGELRRVLEDPCAEVSPSSSDFWVLVAALKGFMAAEGNFPLEGSIPDMHSFTDYFVTLQRVYRQKADADSSAMEARVQQLLKSMCNRDPASISRATVRLFCKNARNLHVLRYRTLREEFEDKGAVAELSRKQSSTDDPSHARSLYLLLRAADRFQQKFHRFPGAVEGDVHEEDIARLQSILQSMNQAHESTSSTSSSSPGAVGGRIVADGAALEAIGHDLVLEFCRFGGCEIHCVAAVLGGVASQEAIKIITKQFVPLSGTLVYNAMSQTSNVIHV